MNKIFKVIYSKTRHCYVVVSELAKSHCKTTQSHTVRSKTALTAAVLLALGAFSFVGIPPVQATDSLFSNDYVGTNYKKDDGSSYSAKETRNYHGAGTVGVGSNTLGMNAIAGKNTITIGDRDASAATESVYIGAKYDANNQVHPSSGKSVVSVGYGSDAAGTGSIAIGSGASADTFDNAGSGTNPDKASQSIAIGNNAQAKQNNIAIGAGSVATATASTADAYLTGQAAVSSYVSVGGGTVTTTDPKTKKMTTTTTLRRLTNVADGAADSDVATVGQLKKLSDKAGVYNEGWGIKIDKTNGNTISVNHNLGNNMNAQLSSTGLILGGDFSNTYDGKYGGAAGDYAVTLGGKSNFALGNISVIAGGYGNHANGELSFIGGGNRNSTSNQYAAILGGVRNSASGESSVVTGGAYNTASGTKSFVGGGYGNIAVGNYSAVIGGWDNRALGNPGGASIATVVGGYQNTANGYHSMVTGGYQNVAWGRDTLVSGGRYNTVLGEMEDGWTQQRLSDASAFGGEGSVVQGLGSVGLAGGSTGKTAYLALAAGYQSVVTDGAAKLEADFSDYGILPVYKDVASAIGYQSTANEAGTISFGHDAGDVSGYTVKWEEDNDPTHDKIDYGSNDYTKVPTVKENHYSDAYYNRLVKVADGIDNHDAVTKEQVQYIGGIYGTDKNDSNYGGKGATGTNSVAIGSNSVAAEDNVVSFGNPDIPAVNIPESQKITHSVSLSDTDKTAINNAVGFDVTKDENWSKISSFKDAAIASSLGSPSYEQDFEKLNNNPEFVKLLKKINNAIQDGTLTYEQYKSFKKYANGTEVETIDAVNIPAKAANYRRVVNMADGINPHDAVAMEQLEGYAKTDASNIGENLKGADGKTASPEKIIANKNAWGTALGVGMVADPTQSTTNDPTKNGSQQLVTGGTVFNETRISAKDDNGQAKTYNYLNANNSAGKNLEALDSALKTVSTTAGAHTVLTVEGNIQAGTGKDAKTNEDVYAGKNILLHESTDDTTGKVTYDLKLAKDINIGTPGKDGEDGKIGIDGRDGHIGLNGSDGITVRGLDGENGAPGKDGVTITGPKGADGIDGKVGISGTDGKDAVFISGKGGVGHIGLTGPAGTNGMDGADGKPGNSIDITVKNGYNVEGKDGKDGINGVDGVDGTSLTRIVYKDATGEHQIATMEDGLKFEGDDGKEIAKKLNNTLEIIGGAKGDLTDGNIGVNSTTDGKLKVQLADELTGIKSISNQKTVDGTTTGAKITLGDDSTVNVNGGKITNVGSGADASGKYTDATKTNAANIGDVQNIVNDAKKELTDGENGLNSKANVDASNIGTNLAADKQQDNLNKWGEAIGTGKVEANNSQLVTGKTVYDEVRPKKDGNYVKANQTTGENLSALDTKIGKLDNNGNYIKKDDTISKNLSTLDTHVKQNEEKITTIKNTVDSLDQNAVKYDDSTKGKISLAGEGGTTISNVKDGKLSDSSTDAVNGKQLWQEQQDRKNMKDISDTGKTVIRDLAKGSVKVVDGKNTTVTEGTEGDAKTYAVNVEGKGTVTSGNTGLISGGTAYTELRPADGTYVKRSSTTAANLSALDTGLTNTSSLIHTNTSGDTIHIGETSKATKVDVSSTDANGNKNGRVVTGVVTDAKDANSAANVGYVNGVTAANTQQIYREMNNAYGNLNRNINRAAAGSNALAALHPLDFDPADKASFAVGYGHYRNANAAAIGAFYYPNANTMVNVGVSVGNGDPGFNAGVSFKIGKGSAYNGVSKAEMAQTIHDQATEISAIKADDAAKDKRIDALEKENQEMKKQIQEILARLNG